MAVVTYLMMLCCLLVPLLPSVFGYYGMLPNALSRRSTPSLISKYMATSSDVNNKEEKPTVAIVGAGAVGAYYGCRLEESGSYHVKFHMRGEHYEKSIQKGLNVTSVRGDMFVPPDQLQAYQSTQEIGQVDWVIVALKSTALDAIPELIYPLLEPGKTRVLAIMNGLIEDDLIASLKKIAGDTSDDSEVQCCGAIYGGMALVCCNRLEPGRIDHSYAGLLSGGVAVSASNLSQKENREAFEKLWEPANVDIAFEPSLLAGRWRKVGQNHVIEM
jgi:2-dehydropantoate 2-reductase